MSPANDDKTPFVAVKFVPAIALTMSANDSFLELLSEASIIATLSFAISTAAAVSSFKSTASDTVPDVPPPDRPSPAVTPCMSPTCPLIVNVPAASSYDNDTPVPAVSNALTWSSIASFAAAVSYTHLTLPTILRV